MSRKPARMSVVNLEEGMPRVEEARLRLEHALHEARGQGAVAVKVIHGYGSSGVGGALRDALQATLRKAVADAKIAGFIPGEEWRIAERAAWELVRRYPEFKKDSDLGRGNRGISIVILQ